MIEPTIDRLKNDVQYKALVELAVRDPAGLQKRIRAHRCTLDHGLLKFIRFMWKFVEPGRDFKEGWHLDAVCEHLEAVTRGEITRLLINVPPGFAKALDDDELIFTTWGWKRHGDLKRGDFVFGLDGLPKRVLGISEPRIERCYRVWFDDGASVVAGEGHLWSIERDVASALPRYRRGRKQMIVSTADLQTKKAEGSWSRRPDRIAIPAALVTSPKRLLIDPYLLGAWLGDGNTTSAMLYAAEEDAEHFTRLGRVSQVVEPSGNRKQRFYHILIDGLQTKLRLLGLLGNKHIPDDYLESSVEQRWELLRGLMDTDGTCSQEGYCSYVTKLRPLAEQIHLLTRSLGLKSWLRETYSVVNSQRCGPYYQVGFTPSPGATVFKLERKQARVSIPQNARSRYRYIERLEPVGERQVRCIQVEDSLYLAGTAFVPTHNSMTLNVFWPAWEWGPKNLPSLRYMTASYSQDLTIRDNVRFRQIILSDLYQEFWGDRVAPSKDQFSLEKVGNTKTGWKLATSVGGVGTGERADRVLIDDPNSVKEVESDKVRDSTNQWLTEVVPTRLNDPSKSTIIIIQQRTHEEDASGTVLSRDMGYEHLMIPMRYDSTRRYVTCIGWTDPRGIGDDGNEVDNDGALAWPELYPEKIVTQLEKDLGPYATAGQLQQLPVPRGGAIFERDWWQTWPIGEDRNIWFPQFEYVVASVDTAFTDKQTNDFSAMTVWGVYRDAGISTIAPRTSDDPAEMMRIAQDERPKVMLMWGWQKRLTLHGPVEEQPWGVSDAEWNSSTWLPERQKTWGLVEWVAYTAKRYRIDHLLIETQAVGHSLEQELRRLHSTGDWGVELINARGDKTARAFAVQHLFSNRLIYAPFYSDSGLPPVWAQTIIDQFSTFPKTRYKDIVDSGTHALQHLRNIGILVRGEEFDADYEEAMRPPQRSTPLYEV